MLSAISRKRFRAAFGFRLENLKNVKPIWLKRYDSNQGDVAKKIERFNLTVLRLLEKYIGQRKANTLTLLVTKSVLGMSVAKLTAYLNELEAEMASFFVEFKATPSLYIKRSKTFAAADATPSYSSDLIITSPNAVSHLLVTPMKHVSTKLKLSKDYKTVFKYEDKNVSEQHAYSEAIQEKLKQLFAYSKGSPSRPMAEEILFGKNKYLSSWVDSYRKQVKTREKIASYNFLKSSILKVTGKGKSRLIGFRYPTEIES